MKKLIPALALVTFLSACSSGSEVQIDTGSHAMLPKINLDVQQIGISDRGGQQAPSTAGFQPSVDQAVRQWASDRFQAVGQSGQAVVIIKDASVTEQGLSAEDDWFTRQQASKYVAHAEIEIDLQGREGNGTVTGQASRFATMPENPSIEERRAAYYEVMNGLIRDLGVNVEKAIHDHIGNFVVGSAPLTNRTNDSMMPPTTQAFMPAQ